MLVSHITPFCCTHRSDRAGINPKDAASVFKKKFASGASVTKEGDVDIQVRSSALAVWLHSITITFRIVQGDLKYEVVELIDEHAEWKVISLSLVYVSWKST
jgi:translation initiation factor 1 (eIF-1/SUI1)